MNKIRALILVTLSLPGILGACAPTVKPADTNDRFKLEGRTLVLDVSAPILHAEGAVLGAVVSRFCAGEATPIPRRCPQRPSGWTLLDIPPGEYGRRLEVGQVLGPPLDGFFDLELEGARVTKRAELTP